MRHAARLKELSRQIEHKHRQRDLAWRQESLAGSDFAAGWWHARALRLDDDAAVLIRERDALLSEVNADAGALDAALDRMIDGQITADETVEEDCQLADPFDGRDTNDPNAIYH